MATIADKLQTIINIKADIKTAIINKGVDVADTDGFATYPDKISQIQGGGSDVVLINGYIDANGTYTAGYDGNQWDGWSSITVDVETSSTGGTALDFSTIGYSEELSNATNAKLNADIAYSKTLYDSWDSSNTSASSLYANDTKLVFAPQIDTSNVTDMSSLFEGCSSLTTIPNFNTSNVTSMYRLFWNCTSLTTIPSLDTSNVTNLSNFFNFLTNSSSLESLPLLDCGKVTNISGFFAYYAYYLTNLTELGGFKDLKIDWSDNYGLTRCPNLTYQSVMNVINNLYDFRTNGDTTTTKTIKFHSNSIALLSEADIAIATNKGWSVTN